MQVCYIKIDHEKINKVNELYHKSVNYYDIGKVVELPLGTIQSIITVLCSEENSVKKDDILNNMFYLKGVNDINGNDITHMMWSLDDPSCYDYQIKALLTIIMSFNVSYNMRELQAFIRYNFNVRKKQKLIESLLDNFYCDISYRLGHIDDLPEKYPIDYKLCHYDNIRTNKYEFEHHINIVVIAKLTIHIRTRIKCSSNKHTINDTRLKTFKIEHLTYNILIVISREGILLFKMNISDKKFNFDYIFEAIKFVIRYYEKKKLKKLIVLGPGLFYNDMNNNNITPNIIKHQDIYNSAIRAYIRNHRFEELCGEDNTQFYMWPIYNFMIQFIDCIHRLPSLQHTNELKDCLNDISNSINHHISMRMIYPHENINYNMHIQNQKPLVAPYYYY